MEIEKNQEGSKLIIRLSGRLAVKESKELDQVLGSSLEGITDLTFDLAELSYISSAGLRSLLLAQDVMDKVEGAMRLVHVQSAVMEVLDLTGFCEFMEIKK